MKNESKLGAILPQNNEAREVQKFVPCFDAALPALIVDLHARIGAILEELAIIYDISELKQSYNLAPEAFEMYEDAFRNGVDKNGGCYEDQIRMLAKKRAEDKLSLAKL